MVHKNEDIHFDDNSFIWNWIVLAKNKFYVLCRLKCAHTVPDQFAKFFRCVSKTMHVAVGHDLGRFTPIFIILSLSDSKNNLIQSYLFIKSFHFIYKLVAVVLCKTWKLKQAMNKGKICHFQFVTWCAAVDTKYVTCCSVARSKADRWPDSYTTWNQSEN